MVTTRERDGDMRYELLESIRSFLTDQQGQARTDAPRRRHLDHYARRIEYERRRETNWDTTDWCRTVAVEEPNLRVAIATALDNSDVDAALRVACGYWVYCLWSGRTAPLSWLSAALDTPIGPDHDRTARCEGITALAVFTSWWELGPIAHSADLFTRAVDLADRTANDHSRARVRYFTAEYLLQRGDRGQARAEFRKAIRIADDRGIAGWCRHSLAWLAAADDDLESAIGELRHILDSANRDELVVPHALAALAVFTAAAGHTQPATALARRAVESATRFDLPGVHVMALLRAAQTRTVCLHHTGTDDGSLRDVPPRLFDQLQRASLRHFVAESLELAAIASNAQGDPEKAARYLGAASALRTAREERALPIPVLGALIDATRSHVNDALGASNFATIAHEATTLPIRTLLAEVRKLHVSSNPPATTGHVPDEHK